MYWTRLEPEEERSRLRKLIGGGVGFQLAYVALDLPSQQSYFLEWLGTVGAAPLVVDIGRLDLRGRDSIDLSLQAMAERPDAPVAVLTGLDSFLCADLSEGNNELLRRLVQPLVMGRERLRDAWPKPVLILLSRRGADRLDKEAPDLGTWTHHSFSFPPPLELMMAEIDDAISDRTQAPLAKRLARGIAEHPRWTAAGRLWTRNVLAFVGDLESLESGAEAIDDAISQKVQRCLPAAKRILAARPARVTSRVLDTQPPRGRAASVLACAAVRKDVSRRLIRLLGGTHRIVALWGPPEAAKGLMADAALRSFGRPPATADSTGMFVVKVSGLHWEQARWAGAVGLAPFVDSGGVFGESLRETVTRVARHAKAILVVDEFERTAGPDNPLRVQIDEALESIVRDHSLNATALLICDSDGFSAFTRLERWSADPIPSRNRILMEGFTESERVQFLRLTEGLSGYDAARLAGEADAGGSLVALRLAGRFVQEQGPLAGETGAPRPIEARAEAYLRKLIFSPPLRGRDTRRLLSSLASGRPLDRETLARNAGLSRRRAGTILARLWREGLVEIAPTRVRHRWVGVFWVRGRFLRDRFRALGAKTASSKQELELENARGLYRTYGISRLPLLSAIRVLKESRLDSEARRIARESLVDRARPAALLVILAVLALVVPSTFWFRSSVERDYAERILLKKGVFAGTTCLDTGLVARDFVAESIPKLNTLQDLSIGAGPFLERQLSVGGARNPRKLFPLEWAARTDAPSRVRLITRVPMEAQDIALRGAYLDFGTADSSFYRRLWSEAFDRKGVTARRLIRDAIRRTSFADLGLGDAVREALEQDSLSEMDRRALYLGARLGRPEETPSWLRHRAIKDAGTGEGLGTAAQLLLLWAGGGTEACRFWDDLVDRLERPSRQLTQEVTLLATECAIASQREARALTALSFAVTRPRGGDHAAAAIRMLVERRPETVSIAAQRVWQRWEQASAGARQRLAQIVYWLAERDEAVTRGLLEHLADRTVADYQAMDLVIRLSSLRPSLLVDRPRRILAAAIQSRSDPALAADFLSGVRAGGRMVSSDYCQLVRELPSAPPFAGTPTCGVPFDLKDLRALLGDPIVELPVKRAAMKWAAASGAMPTLDLLREISDAQWLPLAEALISGTAQPASLARATAEEGLDRWDAPRDAGLTETAFARFAITLGRYLRWEDLRTLGIWDRLRSTDRGTRDVATRFVAGVLLASGNSRYQVATWITALEENSCSIAANAACRDAIRIAAEIRLREANATALREFLGAARSMNDSRYLAHRVLAAELVAGPVLQSTALGAVQGASDASNLVK